jgi:hypothetical protein
MAQAEGVPSGAGTPTVTTIPSPDVGPWSAGDRNQHTFLDHPPDKHPRHLANMVERLLARGG